MIKYSNNEYLRYILLRKLIKVYPLLKPIATVDSEKLHKIKRKL
jgi:hypothetical protein